MEDKLKFVYLNEFNKTSNKIFINSKIYDFQLEVNLTSSKPLNREEKLFYSDDKERENLLLYGQQLNEVNEKKLVFKYYLFPKLNKNFYEKANIDEYDRLNLDHVFIVDMINIDMLSKYLNPTIKDKEKEEKHHIYSIYLELWAFIYSYADSSLENTLFDQLFEVLSLFKIKQSEFEYEPLFKVLNNKKDIEKIMKLYSYMILEKEITPSLFIFDLIRALLKKDNDLKFPMTNLNIKIDSNKYNDMFKFTFKNCQYCQKQIKLKSIFGQFVDNLSIKCPKCKKKVSLDLIVEIINDELKNYNIGLINDDNGFCLFPPYELRQNIHIYAKKNSLNLLTKNEPKLFFSCVYYFQKLKINLGVMIEFLKAFNQKLEKDRKEPNEKIIEENVDLSERLNSVKTSKLEKLSLSKTELFKIDDFLLKEIKDEDEDENLIK